MLDAFLEPWREPILREALAEMVLVGVACGALGVWVVLYGLSYSAESMAHAMFPGLAVAALIGVPLVLGGAAGLALAGAAIALAARVRGIGADNAVAVVITTLFGAGALLALSPASPPGLQGLLFGDVLASGAAGLALAGALAFVVLAGMWLAHWRLLAVGFDRLGARALGIDPLAAELALFVLLAVAVLVAVRGLGNLLVVAALVGPAATARTLTRRVVPMVATACAIGVGAGVGGLYLSYYANIAAGAAIAGLLVLVAAIAASTHTLAARARHARSSQRRRAPTRSRTVTSTTPPASSRTSRSGSSPRRLSRRRRGW
jgi:ABC-type Mn2+/Zn2+ transport system permease subunit